jgi:hypothetical protein
MGDKILIWVFIVIGSGILAYAILGRLFGFHRPTKWRYGGQVSLTGELSMGVFILCLGLTWLHSPVWIIPGVTAFAVGFISQQISRRQYLAKEKNLRQRNAAGYPGVFDNPPPQDIESIDEDELDLFDTGACTYLGRVSKDNVKVLINQTKDIPEQGPNDIYMLVESLGLIPQGSVSPEFVTLLKKAFKKRDYLVIRWMPTSNWPNGARHNKTARKSEQDYI